MRRIQLPFLFTVLSLSSVVQAQEFVRAGDVGGITTSVAIDTNGSTHAGYFGGMQDFDPGPGLANLTAIYGDGYVSRLDANGNFLWAKQFGGSGGSAQVHRIAVDASGNVVAVGYFHSAAIDFDPGPDSYPLTPSLVGGANNGDAFIVKLDSNGNLLWAGQIGGPGLDQAFDVTVASDGRILVVGVFTGTADVNPGTGVHSFTATGGDAFICKLSSAGALVWARQLVASTSVFPFAGIELDDDGNVYTAGMFGTLGGGGSVDLDPGPNFHSVTSAGEHDIFVSKLDGNGDFVWGWRLGNNQADKALGLAVDGSGNVHLAGNFERNVDFDPGSGSHVLGNVVAGRNGFAAKYNSDGEYVWAKSLGRVWLEYYPFIEPQSLAIDDRGNLLLGGPFTGASDFDPGPGAHVLTSAGGEDVFISKLDGLGNFLWALRIGGTSHDRGYGLASRSNGDIVSVGVFAGTVDFDPGPDTHPLTAAGSSEGFVVVLREVGAGSTPDGRFVPGVPLTLAKSGGSSLALTWGASCGTSDVDYEIYEGVLGTSTSHAPIQCSTGGLTTATISPSAGDRYYLVVAATEDLEGSYGKDHTATERPPSTTACLPQLSIGNCP